MIGPIAAGRENRVKFLCDQCKAKYQISDDKVAGKTVRMKCRKCGHMIEVRAAVTGTSVADRNTGTAAAAPTSGSHADSPPSPGEQRRSRLSPESRPRSPPRPARDEPVSSGQARPAPPAHAATRSARGRVQVVDADGARGRSRSARALERRRVVRGDQRRPRGADSHHGAPSQGGARCGHRRLAGVARGDGGVAAGQDDRRARFARPRSCL